MLALLLFEDCKQDVLRPRVPTTPFSAPLTSRRRFSTSDARAVSVGSSCLAFNNLLAAESASVCAVAAVTAAVIASTLVMNAAAAVELSSAVESAFRPAAVASALS